MLKRSALFALVLSASAAFGQQPQLAPGQLLGNNTAAQRPAQASSLTALIDRAFNSNQGSVFNRGPTVWAATRTPVLGLAGTATGTLGFSGLTSGVMTISPQSVAGTGTLLLPNLAGTIVAGASSPLVANATTGVVSCPTCVTSSGGGALTATAPIAVSAAGNISITSPLPLTNGGTNASLTASNGGIAWSNATQLQILAGTATARLPLLSGASATPVWGAFTLPASVTAGGVAYFSSTTAMASTALGTSTQVLHGGATPSWGAVANADMATMATLTVKSNLTGGSATPSDNTLASIFNSQLGSTQGSVAYRGPAQWDSLAPGSSGQLLQSNGPGANPSWVTAGGAGTVTSVACGYGNSCSPSPITTSGTISTSLTDAYNAIGSDIAMPASSTTDGPSVVLTAGRWSFSSTITVLSTGTIGQFACYIWDGGSNVVGSTQNNHAIAAAITSSVTITGNFTVPTGATYKTTCTNNAAAMTMKATTPISGMVKASSISATRIQ